MTRVKQHPKAFAFVNLLGLALVLGLIQEGITGRLAELPNSDYMNDYLDNHDIRYNASVSSLRYDPGTQKTSSFHLVFLENHSDFVITSRYLCVQHVYKDDEETRVKSNVTPWLTGPRVEPIEDTPPPEEVNTRDETLTNYVGDLEKGYYWINAYTGFEFKEEGRTINLLSVQPEAAKRFRKKEN